MFRMLSMIFSLSLLTHIIMLHNKGAMKPYMSLFSFSMPVLKMCIMLYMLMLLSLMMAFGKFTIQCMDEKPSCLSSLKNYLKEMFYCPLNTNMFHLGSMFEMDMMFAPPQYIYMSSNPPVSSDTWQGMKGNLHCEMKITPKWHLYIFSTRKTMGIWLNPKNRSLFIKKRF